MRRQAALLLRRIALEARGHWSVSSSWPSRIETNTTSSMRASAATGAHAAARASSAMQRLPSGASSGPIRPSYEIAHHGRRLSGSIPTSANSERPSASAVGSRRSATSGSSAAPRAGASASFGPAAQNKAFRQANSQQEQPLPIQHPAPPEQTIRSDAMAPELSPPAQEAWRDLPPPPPDQPPPPQPPPPDALQPPEPQAESAVDSVRDRLLKQGISMSNYSIGEHRTVCPKCRGGSSREASLGVTIEEGGNSAVWNCFRAKCGWTGASKPHGGKGGVRRGSGKRSTAAAPPPVLPNTERLVPLEDEALEFFRRRGIGPETLRECGVMQENDIWCPMAGGKVPWALAFPYYRNGQIVNIKYRTPDKKFWQVKGAEKILYGLDDIADADEITIVEGEIDKLSLCEAGIRNAVSVPDGAPAKVSREGVPPPEEDKKYSYLWNCRDALDKAIKVVIATDNDEPGYALGEELSRRLGRERCYRVRWPSSEDDTILIDDPQQQEAAPGAAAEEGTISSVSDGGNGVLDAAAVTSSAGAIDGDGSSGAAAEDDEEEQEEPFFRKDANDVLLMDGPRLLRAYIDCAEEYPIRGLFRLNDFWGEVYSYYNLHMGDENGVSTGWSVLDQYYRVVPGELTIVTGIPNSGKSEWLDALAVNLAEVHGWTFAMCSMEKNAKDHARQLLEKRMRKPFFDLPYAGTAKRMEWPEVQQGMSWLQDRIFLIRYEDDELPSVDWVLNLARAAVLRHGIRGLIIDPYNELDHQRPRSMTETEYVSQMLTKVKRFAQHHECHVWFVAHPKQMRDWKGEPPNLYDISGSAHFINKADCGVVVHRNRDPEKGPLNEAQILVRKVRNKAAGTIGEAALLYDSVSGRFEESGSPQAVVDPTGRLAGPSIDFSAAQSKFEGK